MASASARYSASVLDRATTVCFLLQEKNTIQWWNVCRSKKALRGGSNRCFGNSVDSLMRCQSVLAVMLAKAGFSAYLLLDLNQ